MIKTKQLANQKLQKRRSFLSRTTAIGGMALLGTLAVSPVQAGKKKRKIEVGNAKVKDFKGLVGKKFKLVAEDGSSTRARLVDASVPKAGNALRFRREHFSIVFDVPGSFKCVQGEYRIKHSKVGSLKVFMGPVDLPEKHNRLEAIFT